MKTSSFAKHVVILSAALALVACANNVKPVPEQIADQTDQSSSCDDFSGKVHSILAQSLIDGQDLPPVADVQAALQKRFAKGGDQNRLVEEVTQIYRMLTEDAPSKLRAKTKDELLEALTAVEIGDHTTPERAEMSDSLRGQFSKIQSASLATGKQCDEPSPTPAPTPVPSQKAAVIAGAMRVMATTYQSCSGIRLPAMTSSTASVSGISVVGEHSSGTGLSRLVTDLASLNRTHYYIKGGIVSAAGCFDVTKSPLIYDYGGKPSTGSADDSPLDFFKNAGTGTSVLGYDCSAFVFSSMAAQGLRAIAGKKLKALQVHGISSSMMMNPSSNGLTCLTAPKMDASGLKSGDILAINGHVVILDVTGSDPFGLARAKSVSDCTSSKLTSSGFAFDVLQSSPVKGGIGIDRMRAPDYLADSSTMRSALVSYAVSACKVKFGQPADAIPSNGHIVRHKGTADCFDTPVPLARESCVTSCYAGTGLKMLSN